MSDECELVKLSVFKHLSNVFYCVQISQTVLVKMNFKGGGRIEN